MTGPPSAGAPSQVRLIAGELPVYGSVFFYFQLGSSNSALDFTSSFAEGPGTYKLPSTEVAFDGSVEVSGAVWATFLHILSGQIVVQTAEPMKLAATLDTTFATETGIQFALTAVSVELSCQYDHTVCH